MTTIHNKFTHEGKSYTAEPKPYVRIDGVLYKVKSTDGDGNATIVASSKKDPAPEDVAVAFLFGQADPETKPETADATDAATLKVDLATLKARWAKAHDEVERIKAENATRLEMATRLLAVTESTIATNLLGRERKPGDGPQGVRLGETRYRAAKSRDGGPPRLIVVPTVADAE